jgi:hypothetical protein
MPSLTQILFGSLLDSPAVVELASKAGTKALSIIKQHFTYSAAQITTAYQDGFGYALMAISVGMVTDKSSLTHNIFNAKITREFADQIDSHYLQPFIQAHHSQNQDWPDFRRQTAKILKYFAKNKDQIFSIKTITEEDLAALISYRDTLAITDLVLAQMQPIAKLDDTLIAFLRFNDLLGDGVLFYFRELVRKDERLNKTQAELQREGLCIAVQTLHTQLKASEDNIINAIKNGSNMVEIAQPRDYLHNIDTAWQARNN